MSMTDTTSTDQTMTNPLTDLTGFQRDLLVTISHLEENGSPKMNIPDFGYDDPSGQCVKGHLEETGYEDIHHGRLYPNLDTIANKGLVDKIEINRRTNGYVLTTGGKNSLSEYRSWVGETVKSTEENPVTNLNGFQRDLLVEVSNHENASGQTILDDLNEVYHKEVTHGRIYPNLDVLVEEGFVEKGEIDRRTNYYVLTPSGEQDLDGYREFIGE